MFRKLFATGLVAFVAGCAGMAGNTVTDSAAADATASVAATAERLRIAMIDPTRENLAPLLAEDLSYGHSGGKVDSKASFMSDLLDGKSDFVTIVITEQTVKPIGSDLALVRHTLAADTNDSGKPGKVTLKVLGVWQKQGGQWRLLARQAVRPA